MINKNNHVEIKAEIFVNPQSAGQHSSQMKQSTMVRFQGSGPGKILGEIWQGMLSAAQQMYNEAGVRAWTGRYWLDGQPQANESPLQGNLHGWNPQQEQTAGPENKQEATQEPDDKRENKQRDVDIDR